MEVRVTSRVRLQAGDLVFSRLHTQNGAFAFSDRSYLATTTFLPLSIDENEIDRRFLFWALHIRVPSLSASDTVGRETYRPQDILALQIPLPALSEQRRIVARIEQLAAQIEEVRCLRRQAAEETGVLLTGVRRVAISACQANTIPLEEICIAIIDNLHSNPRLADAGIPCIRSPTWAMGH